MRRAIKKFFFGLALFVLGFQVSTLFLVLLFFDWEGLMRDADTVSLVWVKNRAYYERLIAVLEEHGYGFEPWSPNTVAGDVIVYGDVRPLAPLIAEVGGGRVVVYTKRFEPSPESFIHLWGGPITVFSTSAALLGALLWAAALVAVAWYVASRRLMSLFTSLLIVFALPLLYLAELGYLVAVGGSAWDALMIIASALASPALLLLGFAIAKARRVRVQ